MTKNTPLIQDGDMVLILRPDGSIGTLAFGVDLSAIEKPFDQMTEDEKDLLDRSSRLYALAGAANNNAIMETLIFAMSGDGDAQENLKAFTRPN